MEPSTAECLAVSVLVRGKSFTWIPGAGLDPEAILEVEPWTWTWAIRLRYPAAKAGLTPEDLLQEGRVGALVAARSYDPFHPSKAGFFTWARLPILRHMINALRFGDVTVPARDWDHMRREKAWPTVVSLDGSLNDTNATLKDFLQAEAKPMPGGLIRGPGALRDALAALPERHRAVLCRHYGFQDADGEGESFDSIGADLGLSKQRVKQVELQARVKLRVKLAKRGVRSW